MSLRARLLGLVLLATLLPALLLGWRFVRESNAEIAAAVKTLASSADNLASNLDDRVQGTAQLHYGLAHSRFLDSDDRAACSAYLSEVRAAYPQYTGIVTVLPDGSQHCDSLQGGRGKNLSDRSYVQRSVNGARGLIVEPAFAGSTGHAVLQVVYPARAQSGALRFMLVASLDLHRFAHEALRSQSRLAAPEVLLGDAERQRPMLVAPEVLLVDAKGTVMAWTGQRDGLPPPGSSIADGPAFALARSLPGGGTGELVGHGGQPEVWAVANSPGLRAAGLQVMLGLPRHALAARAEQRLAQGLVVLCGAALLLFAGVWSLAERGIRRPVSRITEMVRALGAGDLSARIALPHPRGELGGLMAVFNHTAASLQAQRSAIDELGSRLREAHLREIDEREANEVRLSQMANFDSLTGLPNRTLFRERLRQAITRANRSGKPFALMFLDIDRFKHINDSLGHDIGDRLLVAVSRVLSGCLRGTDALARNAAQTATEGVFRLGGDEFTILTDELAGPGSVAAVAQRILATLRRPFTIGDHELFTTASLGLTVYAGAGADASTDLDALIKQADMAMYRAKELGRDTFFIYDAELNTEAVQRHRLEARLRHALDRNEFVLHYQPKADLASGRVTGVEALVRWQPAGAALVGPDRFIPILEETGLIIDVGAWVLREACAQMVRWRHAGMRPLSLAVNVSARQFRQPDLVGHVAQILAQTGFDPERLEVELTESMLIDDSGAVLATLAGLRAMGVRIAIDDFGTGQSSLRYLKRFNVDSLKIDRSFVMDTPDDVEDSAIAAAVIALAHGLHLNVVAEGVETRAQVDFLRSHGCHEMQGYLLSRPVDGVSFARWFERHEAPEHAEIA